MVSTFGAAPIENGIVWREIAAGNFASFPFLDENGAAAVPVYKTTGSLVTTDGSAIVVTIPTLTSTTASTRPYYFRTYAKNPLGIGYGNPVIFNCAPPVISTPIVTNGTTMSPTFAGTLTVNAGTPQGTVTEYGYCSGTMATPTTADNKVVLSTTTTLTSLNTILNSETFTADPAIDLAVGNYSVITQGANYFRYYVVANGVTTYSPVAAFYPVPAGSAIVSSYSCATASAGTLIVGTTVSGVAQTITATVTRVGAYSISAIANGVTFTGSGTFTGVGAQNVVLTATGTPTATGTSSFVLNTSPNCSFNRTTISTTSNGTAVVSSYSCTTASAGTLTVNSLVEGVTQTITATVTSAGTYSIFSIANGVTFFGSGTFTGTGVKNVVLTATGTPSAVGSYGFVLNTSPNCSFARFTAMEGIAICDGSAPTTVVPFTSITGKIWMDRNLGASRAGTSATDYGAYGCLYQWGRGNDGHASIIWTSSTAGTGVNGMTTTLSSTDSPGHNLFIITETSPHDWRSPQNNTLWQGVAGINNPCPAGYRVPNESELTEEFTAYGITNSASAYASSHKFVVAGDRSNPGAINYAGAAGYYWSSSTWNSPYAQMHYFGVGNYSDGSYHSFGFSVRCIKD